MDALRTDVIEALEYVICATEDLPDVHITQDLKNEELIIESEYAGFKTHMNCRMNSIGATIRQICKHINNKTLFSYEEDYTIGC